jgi:hypothetical protein
MKNGVILIVLLAVAVMFVCPAYAQAVAPKSKDYPLMEMKRGTDVSSQWTLGAKPTAPKKMTPGAQLAYNQALKAYTESKGYQLKKFLDGAGYTARGYKYVGAEKQANGHVRILLLNEKTNSVVVLDSYQKAGSSEYAFKYESTVSALKTGSPKSEPWVGNKVWDIKK